MALSNWDTLAFSNEGQPCNGVLKGFDDQTIAIYKNWAYVHDPKGWYEGLGFSKPVIAQINYGSVTVAGFNIIACRGPQQAIFLYAECGKYEKDRKQTKRMAGIGCYGFDDPVIKIANKLNINLDDYDDAFCSSLYSPGKENFVVLHLAQNDKLVKEIKIPETLDVKSDWVGVTEATYKEFMEWLCTSTDHNVKYNQDFFEWITVCRKNDPLRFCQGDAFFAKELNLEINATKIGQAESPILTQMCDKPVTADTPDK